VPEGEASTLREVSARRAAASTLREARCCSCSAPSWVLR